MVFRRRIHWVLCAVCMWNVIFTVIIIWNAHIYGKLLFYITRRWSNNTDNVIKTCVYAEACTKSPMSLRSQEVSMPLAIPPNYPKNGTGVSVTTKQTFDFTEVNKLCQNDIEAIVPVYSAVHNHARRLAIRDTIGQTCEQYKCKVVFIVGFANDGLLSTQMKAEYHTYGDILFVSRVDTYRDLNDKAVAMLDWLIEFCSQSKYVIHFVDDAFVNIKLFLEDLQAISNAVYGYVCRGIGPIRYLIHENYVSKKEYPYEVYPDFVTGVAYAFPNSISKSLRRAVYDAIYVWLEDVWLTGHVRELAGIQVVNSSRKMQRYGPIYMAEVDKYLYFHPVQVNDFYKLHHQLKFYQNSLNLQEQLE